MWQITTQTDAGPQTHDARVLVNATGSRVSDILRDVTPTPTTTGILLGRGSCNVTRKLYDHDRCYFFQRSDGRIISAIPDKQDFSLIGTTDPDPTANPGTARRTDAKRNTLCAFASQYGAKPVPPSMWSGPNPGCVRSRVTGRFSPLPPPATIR